MRETRLALFVLCLASLPNAAHARFHFWDVNEVFSNADGTVQFVEFTTASGFQDLIGTHAAEFRQNGSGIGSAPFGTDLFTTDTGGHLLLIATPDFQAAAGIEPDYLMPASSIPVATVDAVRMSGAATTELDFTAGTLPLDGTNSLTHTGGIPAATPTNFLGETGTIVPEPAASGLGAVVLGTLGLVVSRGAARRR